MTSRNTTFSAKVTGVRELNSAFRAVDDNLPKELRLAFLGIAEHVAGLVRAKMPWVSGKAAGSVKAGATQRGSYVQEGINGGPKKDYVPWLDFGGDTGRGRTGPGTGSIHRDFIPGGRYLYPTAESQADASAEAALNAVEKVARQAGLNVTETI
jgi:hypothetical protein